MNKIVIHIFGSLNLGGAESRVMDLFRNLDDKTIKFYFISLDTSNNQYFENEIIRLGGKVFKIGSPNEIGIIKHFLKLIYFFIKVNIKDNIIVHAHTLHHSGLVLFASKIANVKIRICHSRSTSTNNQSIYNKTYIFIGKLLIKIFATDLLAVSPESAIFLYGREVFNKGKVRIIPNAIEINDYIDISLSRKIQLRNLINAGDSDIIIGHIGRFELMKNHSFIINLFYSFSKQYSNSKLVLIGDGKEKNNVIRLVEELNISEKVYFLGVKNNINEWLQIFDVFVMPSKYEGLCNVVIEAQAAGIPSVISDTIPISVDLGLGLVKRLSLSSDISEWIIEIEKSKVTPKIDYKIRLDAFRNKNYTIDNALELLNKIYNK